MPAILTPDAPLTVALVGAGARMHGAYLPVLPALAPWLRVTAVCATSMAHAAPLAERFGARPYGDLRQLVADRPMEAVIAVTGTDLHYAISVYLSRHGVHHLVETPWSGLVCQARRMVEEARRGRVIARAAENFIRAPIDRFARVVRDAGYLGRIGRVVSYADLGGFHANSRWIAFAGAHPDWVQCLEHEMSHPPLPAGGMLVAERLSARFVHFPSGLLVMDVGSGHGKGLLGRHPRPGYVEWQGETGTLVSRAPGHRWDGVEAELRKVLAGGDGVADVVTPVAIEEVGDEWFRVAAETPEGPLEYRNPYHRLLRDLPCPQLPPARLWNERSAIADLLVDFVLDVRGLRSGEFTDEDALQSVMMLAGARESARQEGRRITLPLDGELESEALDLARRRAETGVDPLDAEAMLARAVRCR